MSAELKSLFPATPALRSVLRPEDLAAETLARHLPWLSAPADNLILTRQGDLLASAVVEGQDSFTTEEGDLSLATTSLARLVGQLGKGFGFHVSKLTLPDTPQLKPFDGEGSGEAFAAMVDAHWQGHLRDRIAERGHSLVTEWRYIEIRETCSGLRKPSDYVTCQRLNRLRCEH